MKLEWNGGHMKRKWKWSCAVCVIKLPPFLRKGHAAVSQAWDLVVMKMWRWWGKCEDGGVWNPPDDMYGHTHLYCSAYILQCMHVLKLDGLLGPLGETVDAMPLKTKASQTTIIKINLWDYNVQWVILTICTQSWKCCCPRNRQMSPHWPHKY